MRWQEVFRGADDALMHSKFTEDSAQLKKRYWAPTAEERRKKLFPFLWSAVVPKGQIYGNRSLSSNDEVANSYHFSYPGYNEIFTGFPDKRMNTNDAVLNPNSNVLEYINHQKGFEGKVAAFSSWERFPQILNVQRSGLLVNSGYMNLQVPNMDERLKYLNKLQYNAPHYLGDSTRLDFLTFEFGKEYLKQYHPRVLYIAFDETDDMAHAGNYPFYLDRAHQEDGFLQQLWSAVQALPGYRGKTTLIITCDHGRGDQPLENWRDHGADTPHSEQTWFAVIGPDTPAAGEMKNTQTRHEQLAQTIARLLGLDFSAAAGHPVGNAISSVIKTGK